MEETQHSPKRPKRVWTLFGLLLFVGLTALGGGIEMVLFPKGNQFVSGEWLEHVPFDSWVIPGLVLGIGFGIGSLTAVFGIVRRPNWRVFESVPPQGSHWSWTLTVAVGFGLGAWIGLEVVLIPERSLIEVLYGAIAITILLLAWSKPVRTYLRASVDSRRRATTA